MRATPAHGPGPDATAPRPLRDELRALIAAEGPISVARYMALALAHPVHGYYITRDPLGAGGDFTTAPEISQMFGELLGLWAAEVWIGLGAPTPVRLVELGPGRGTLMADALRAARAVPAFRAAVEVHLVETSPVLREAQARTLASQDLPKTWHTTIDTLPAGPMIVLANEFFDALPIRQFQQTRHGWCERLIGLDATGELTFGLAAASQPDLSGPAPDGATLELCPAAQAIMGELCRRIAAAGGALLAIDYGAAETGFGDTLQAVRAHRFVDPLATPGEADLTAHVDFAALARTARARGLSAHGATTQGRFLRQLGIAERAAALMARATPAQAENIAAALTRLTGAAPGMGDLFKVLAVTPAQAPAPPGFAPEV